jgi:hypothetical protein
MATPIPAPKIDTGVRFGPGILLVATVGRSAGAYTLTVPQLCPLEQGLSPSFSLVVSYYPSLPQGGFGPTVSENLGTFTVICAPTSQTAQATSAPQVMSCGGTTNPLTADKCSKTAGNPTMSGFIATCGASTTITGNTFPAESSDWLEFVVPASHMTCKTASNGTPYVSVHISSSGGILFDVYQSPAAGTAAAGVPQYAGLGTGTTGLAPGSYYIKIYGMTQSTVGTWTLKVSS